MSVFNSNQHFAINPVSVDLKRSTFDRSSTHKTTFDSGKLVPIFIDEVLPGDTFNLSYSYVVRLSTPLFPTMDTANLDTYFFFVPTRIIWNKFQKFMGENTNAWTDQSTEELVPIVKSTSSQDVKTTYYVEDLASYLGIPLATKILDSTNGVNQLPFRAYAKIWNDWFRDQNTQQTIYYPEDSSDLDMNNYNLINDSNNPAYSSFYQSVQYGKELAPVNKYQDYFTSCLPGPQKGDPVQLPLTGNAPIRNTYDGVFDGSAKNWPDDGNWFTPLLATQSRDGSFNFPGNSSGNLVGGVNSNDNLFLSLLPYSFSQGSSDYMDPNKRNKLGIFKTGNVNDATRGVGNLVKNNNSAPLYANMYADLTNITSATVNQLRQAFQIQRLLEKDARGGTRYIEIIRSHFGVISPDARLQRSEYLGGGRQPITIEQVLQTSSTDSTSPLGQTGAFSLTVDRSHSFIKSFTEHGFIIGVACVRVNHSYAQGLSKLWTRRRRYDYYFPVLANIGEQPIFKKEIYFTPLGTSNNPNESVFGYNEAWADYRYKLNQVSGKFSPQASQTLKAWTYTDYYTSAPTLSNQWIQEDKTNIQQTLAIQNQPQIIADFYFNNKATRPMPVYSVPGLIDHN